MIDDGAIDITPVPTDPGRPGDAPPALPAPDPEPATTIPAIDWAGGIALFAAGAIAAVVIGGWVGAALLAVGMAVLAVVVVADALSSKVGPVNHAARASWALWQAAKAAANGDGKQALQYLKMASVTDWFWLLVLALAILYAFRRTWTQADKRNKGR